MDDDNGLIWQDEECTLCKEHFASPDNNIVIDWPMIEYPGNDKKCIGYCPCKNFTKSRTQKNQF